MRTGQEAAMDLRGSDRPVFLDESGRRARRIRWVGRGLKALVPAWLVAVLLGALTPLSLPALPVEVAASHGTGGAAHEARQAPGAARARVDGGRARSVPVSLRARVTADERADRARVRRV